MASMMLVLIVAAALLSSHAGAGSSLLTGIVEYSFEESHKLLRTKKYIYQIKSNALSEQERKIFDAIGSRVQIHPNPGSIERVWSITPDLDDDRSIGAIMPADSITAEGEDVLLTGTLLPTVDETNAVLLIRNTIYRVEKNLLSSIEKEKLSRFGAHVTLRAPRASISLAWNAFPEIGMNRIPAKILADERQRDFVHRAGDMLTIRGTLEYSFDEAMLLVRSGHSFFQIRDSALRDQAQNRTPGAKVTVRVAASDVQLAWTSPRNPSH